MKLPKSKYDRIDALSKLIGLVLLAVGVDSVSTGNYFLALALFGLGGLISIVPLFIGIETSA